MELHKESIGFLIADLARLMRHAFEQRTEGSCITLAQSRALLYLERNEGIRQVELAGLLEVQPITLARLIDHLHAEGLVERRADPADRRAYRLYLTAAAEPRLAAIRQVVGEIRADVLDGIDPQQVSIVLAALNRMRSNLLAPQCLDSGEHAQ
ncbi:MULTISPECIES: MarR family transcriptional regulator [Oxalobacteraceae]|jgi:DNA-binding MarR family transcriptional regulator|uniref:MarR family winged helix-turn-helix transcriptional regulator n=1 Tax=Oxalobacteraceae TaxID=75682 RepID=UPI0010A34C73|nr:MULTISPECIES: MarR family transcriptional regulator [Oxalobacteraceae]